MAVSRAAQPRAAQQRREQLLTAEGLCHARPFTRSRKAILQSHPHQPWVQLEAPECSTEFLMRSRSGGAVLAEQGSDIWEIPRERKLQENILLALGDCFVSIAHHHFTR